VSGGFALGDVVRYETLDRPNGWCREGIAIATKVGSRLKLLDTYWSGGSETHALTDAEVATAELIFNIGDYDELDRYSSGTPRMWEKYAPADREIITEQHGHSMRWFIRKGASEDWPTQIDNARRRVAERESDLAVTQRSLEWERQELARIIAAAEVPA
jgi:hypothetical protein